MRHTISEGSCEDSRIEGPVTIAEGARVERSILRGPVVIGERCVIRDSYIGPFTSIASGSQIENAEIEYSIVMEDCEVRGLDTRISASLIGRAVKVCKTGGKPSTLRLVLGDSSAVLLP